MGILLSCCCYGQILLGYSRDAVIKTTATQYHLRLKHENEQAISFFDSTSNHDIDFFFNKDDICNEVVIFDNMSSLQRRITDFNNAFTRQHYAISNGNHFCKNLWADYFNDRIIYIDDIELAQDAIIIIHYVSSSKIQGK